MDSEDRFDDIAVSIGGYSGFERRICVSPNQFEIQVAAFAAFPFGVIWIAADRRVLSMNQRAVVLSDREDGIWIKDNRLHARAHKDQLRLDQALSQAMQLTDSIGSALVIRRHRHALPLMASVMPIAVPQPTSPFVVHPAVLVILQDPADTKPLELAHLETAFGVTKGEGRLAEALLSNETLQSYGTRAGVSMNTVRTHLAGLFKKTGTKRQAELVRLLMLIRPVI